MTSMDVSKVFYSRIETTISEDETVASYLSDVFPNFHLKMAANDYSEAELQIILASISSFSSIEFQTLTIITRLCGGVSETARLLSIPHDILLNALMVGSAEKITPIIKQIRSAQLFDDSFFQKKRAFYTESMLARFRRVNITKILATASDYNQVVKLLAAELSPFEDVLLSLQTGESHSRSHWACRRIEAKLGIPIGSLDKQHD